MPRKRDPNTDFMSELNLTDEAATQAQLALSLSIPHSPKPSSALHIDEQKKEDEDTPDMLWRAASC